MLIKNNFARNQETLWSLPLCVTQIFSVTFVHANTQHIFRLILWALRWIVYSLK